jgi:aerobic C4-dicarboxylate transport protein
MTKAAATAPKKPWYKVLYIQVLLAIVLGALLGWLFPAFGTNDWIHALGDGFIKLIRMVIAPIIFCTVVSGIAHVSQVSKVGRVAIKALVYFEIVSTFALIIGLVVANLLQPGAGFTGQGNAAAVAGFAKQSQRDEAG